MRWIAFALLGGVFVANDGANWLSAKTGVYPWAVFFMLQGAWTAIVSVCAALFVWDVVAPSLERSIALAALGISALEAAEIPACGVFVSDFAAIPRGVNVCDYVTGFPATPVTVTLEVCFLAWMIGSYLRR